MSDDIALAVRNLSKCYPIHNKDQNKIKKYFSGSKESVSHEFWALQDINFEVKKGEAFGIIGRNGSGKSTLLQLICKILLPTTGEIITKGRIAALLELGAGFNPDFTGRENIYINGAILGFTAKEIEKRFDEIVEFADIGYFIDQPVKSYSSGMFVRLAFAVQACVEPDILIIDEALAVGDIFFRQKCYKLLNKFLEKGVSIILVSHAMNEIEQTCQRAILLDGGKTVYLGSANEAAKHYYLIEQKSQIAPSGLSDIVSSSEELLPETPPVLDTKEFFWPKKSAFIDISRVNQISNGWGTCTGVAVCDNQGNACYSFQQGETASFFYEFELCNDIEIPLTGIVIQNDKGINVHGKGTLEYGTSVPHITKSGDKLRIRQDITLELAIDEYTFEIGLATMKLTDYANRMSYSYKELYPAAMRICTLSNVAVFSIRPRSRTYPVQLLHHGLANLPGNCQMIKITSPDN